jgi:dihydrofolate reductase
MGYVILQLALTLDGYIARPDGSVDFLDGTISEFDVEFQSFVSSIDSIVMGRNTYEKMRTFGEIPFKDKRILVLTHQIDTPKEEHVHFVNQDVVSLFQQQKGNIWLFGGSNLIRQCLEYDLIDEYQLFVVPQLIGDGIRLFQSNKTNSTLTLQKIDSYGDNVYLVYTRNRE